VVDMGVIIQGGINVTFSKGVAGHRVSVIASELLIGMNGFNSPTGAVQVDPLCEFFCFPFNVFRSIKS
jgi:hypothetical protein